MATNGQLNTNIAYDSYFWVNWLLSSQDIAANKSKIAWSCGVYCGHTFYQNAIKMSAISINGVQVYGGGTYSNFSKGEHRIAYGSLDIPHNPDGTKTFSISSFTGWLYSNNNYASDGGSYALTAIPRAATLVSATDFTDLQNPTVTYSNPAGASASVLQAYIYDTDDRTILVEGKDLPRTGTSLTLDLTDEEIDKLRNVTTGSSKKVWFYIKTVIGGVTYWSSKDERTFSVVESSDTKPVVNMSVTLNNELLPDKFAGMWIQGKSKADINISAEGKYGATINSYWANVDGKGYTSPPFTSDVIQHNGMVDIIGYAKDSREFTGSTSQRINVIEYAKPMVVPISSENAILCYRSDMGGVKNGKSTSVWVKAKKSFNSVSGNNQCSLQCRRKLVTEQWNNNTHLWEEIIAAPDYTQEFNFFISGTFDATKAYTVQIRAIDDLGEEDVKTFEIPTEDVALHLGKGGKNVAVGTYCDYSEERTFYSDWKAIFDKDVVVGGNVLIGPNKTTLRDYILSVISEGG